MLPSKRSYFEHCYRKKKGPYTILSLLLYRYWRPGPLDGFSRKRYFNFGFLYLQDLIDRALMNLMLNETIDEPGVYLQQFPYPCYVQDK